jgi:hypothetical protein
MLRGNARDLTAHGQSVRLAETLPIVVPGEIFDDLTASISPMARSFSGARKSREWLRREPPDRWADDPSL